MEICNLRVVVYRDNDEKPSADLRLKECDIMFSEKTKDLPPRDGWKVKELTGEVTIEISGLRDG